MSEASLPPGTRRLTPDEERWLAESARWSTSAVSNFSSAWVTEHEFVLVGLPGRELWMTPAEYEALLATGRAARDPRGSVASMTAPKQDRSAPVLFVFLGLILTVLALVPRRDDRWLTIGTGLLVALVGIVMLVISRRTPKP